jgi:hypothetical protein
MSKRNGKAAIVGIGEVPTGRFPDTEAIQFAVQSAKLAIEDAGIDKDEIDCIMPTAAMFSSVFTNEMATGGWWRNWDSRTSRSTATYGQAVPAAPTP